MPEIMNFAGVSKIYNLTYAVGEECANRPEDVMLVQWLLKRHFSRADKKTLLGNRWDINVINGIYDESLCDMIKIFQFDFMKNNSTAKYHMDGKMFPVRDVSNPGKYPLLHLNFSVQSYFKKYYENPKSDPFSWQMFNQMIDKCGKM